ncbi:hypothetical protein ACWCXX_20365 [Streptomyces sp. NPDC001732]
MGAPVLSGMAGWWQGEYWCESQVDATIPGALRDWAQGWNWCYRHGGPIGSWVTGASSVTTPDETAARGVAALLEGREWLERMAQHFAEPAPPPGSLPRGPQLAPGTGLRPARDPRAGLGREGGWHGQATQILRWFLTTTGMGRAEAEQAVESAIGGRFESWVTSEQTLAESVGEDLAVGLTGHAHYQDHRERATLDDLHDRY